MLQRAFRGLLGLTLLFCAVPAAAAVPGDCAALARLTLPAVTVTQSEAVPAGAFTPPGGKTVPEMPAFCRVAGVIKPSPDSDIRFEVWMPASGWSGRFQGVGNGGFAGTISYAQMAVALKAGDATASTDTGHQSAIATDASWALGHPEKLVDFGYRAIHETTLAAKAFVREFYGKAPAHSYFNSCSNGGRQGLMEAQRYPEDYDGIVSGAPANYWTHLLANGTSDVKLLLDNEAYIPAGKLPAIQKAVLAACDTSDGVNDGTIENPASCHPDPAVLQCRGAESADCLTEAQAAALRKLYAGSRTADGKPFFFGSPPGGEAESGGWGVWITGKTSVKESAYWAFSTQFFGNIVFGDPKWDPSTFDLDRDSKVADDKAGKVLNAVDPDLRRFHARGGKLLLYHGWSDAAIPAANTIAYYESVVATMGAKEAAGFVRLFLVPGMQHCTGGSGATSFGQSGPGSGNANGDIVTALEGWVEKGVPPDGLVAVRRKLASDPASEVVRSRPLCAYPLVAKYKGTGSVEDAANFSCGK
jgi:feruloyl esterase